MNGKMLTIDDVAEFLGVHRDTVYSLVRSGRLPAMQLGGRKAGWRVAQEDLDTFVAESKARTVHHADRRRLEIAGFEERQRQELLTFQERQRQEREEFATGKRRREPDSGQNIATS